MLCKRAQREFTLNLPSAAKYYIKVLQIYTKIPETPHPPQHKFHPRTKLPHFHIMLRTITARIFFRKNICHSVTRIL